MHACSAHTHFASVLQISSCSLCQCHEICRVKLCHCHSPVGGGVTLSSMTQTKETREKFTQPWYYSYSAQPDCLTAQFVVWKGRLVDRGKKQQSYFECLKMASIWPCVDADISARVTVYGIINVICQTISISLLHLTAIMVRVLL